MKKLCLFLLSAVFVYSSCYADSENSSIGFVNFKNCVEKSKQGQQEKAALESLKRQLTEALQKTDKELEDLAKKLEDQDYMDGLSPTAEEELKQRFQTLSQEFGRYQNQYYQMLNQANMKMLQSLHESVRSASEVVRDKHHLVFLINEDSAFAVTPTLNFTEEVVVEMDKSFELNNSSQTASLEHAESQ